MQYARGFVLTGLIFGLGWALAAEQEPAKEWEKERREFANERWKQLHAPAYLDRADSLARQAEACRNADEAGRLYRAARWALPAPPPDLPEDVDRVLGCGQMRHGGSIYSLAVSPDGTTLASASEDRTVKLWNLANGRLIRTQTEHDEDTVHAVLYHPKGDWIASAAGKEIYLWEPATGKLIRKWTAHKAYITCLAIRPDGAEIASGSDDRSLRLWDPVTGKERANLGDQKAMLYSLAYSPDGKLLASTNGNGGLEVWNPASTQNRLALTLEAHAGSDAYMVLFTPDGKSILSCGAGAIKQHGAPGPNGERTEQSGQLQRTYALAGNRSERICSIALSPDGKLLAGGCRDGTIRLWEAANPSVPARTLAGHSSEVRTLLFLDGGKRLVSAGFDQSIRHWELENEGAYRTFAGSRSYLWSAAWIGGSDRVAAGGADRVVHLWSASAPQESKPLVGHTQPITAIADLHNGRQLLSASGDKLAKLWNLESGQCERTYAGHRGVITSLVANKSGSRFITGSADRTLRLWDLKADEAAQTWAGHQATVTAVAWRVDELEACSGSTDGWVKLWDAKAGKEIRSFRAHETGGVAALAYRPDGQLLATAGADGSVRLWNLAQPSKEPIVKLEGHSGALSSIDFSPTGQYLASAGSDTIVKIWDVANRTEFRSFRGHGDWVTSVQFSPDGSAIVSASVDRTARIWKLHGDSAVAPILAHSRSANAVCYVGNGALAASGSDDRTVILWNPADAVGKLVLEGHTTGVSSVAASSDGQFLITAGRERTVKLWDVSGKPLRSYELPAQPSVLAFNPDGKSFLAWTLTGSEDEARSTLHKVDRESGEITAAAIDQGRRVLCMALAPDCQTAAMGGADGVLRFWNLAKAEQIGKDVKVIDGSFGDLIFAPDGKQLIVADSRANVRVIDVDKPDAKGKSFRAHETPLAGFALAPERKQFATYTADGEIKLWPLGGDAAVRTWKVGQGIASLAFAPDGKTMLTANADGTLYRFRLPPGN